MADFMYSPSQGRYFYRDDDGQTVEVPETVATSTLGDRLLIGAGRQLTRLGRGVQSLLGDEETRARLAQVQAEENALFDPLQQAFPVSTAIGEALPSLATLPIGGGLVTQAGLAGAEGALSFAPDRGQQVMQGALGLGFGGAGYGLGQMASRVGNAITGIARPLREAPEAARFADLGGFVTPGQRIQNPGLQQFEAGMSSNPFMSRFFAQGAEQTQDAAARVAGDAIGLPNAGRITEETLALADDQLSRVFNELGDNVGTLNMGDNFGERVLTLESFRKLRGLGGLEGIEQGVITGGREFQTVRQALVEEGQRAASRGQGELMKAINSLVDDLDNAAGEFISPDQFARYAQAREQWRNLKIMQAPGVIKDGDISLPTLNNRLRQNYGTTFTQNRLDRLQPETANLFEFVKAGASPAVRPIVGDPGTATRLGTQQAIGDVAEGLVNRDPGSLARVLGLLGVGEGYELLARNAPGVLGGLVEPLQTNIGGRIGARVASPELLDEFRRE